MIASSVCEKGTELRLTRGALARIRRKALRQRCWYKALSSLERGMVDLTMKCVLVVRSRKLRTMLTKILDKLVQAFGSRYLDMVEGVGRPLAARISRLAQSWGNRRAVGWEDDATFTRYLGANALNPETRRLAGFRGRSPLQGVHKARWST